MTSSPRKAVYTGQTRSSFGGCYIAGLEKPDQIREVKMFLRVVILVLAGIYFNCSYGWEDFELEALLAFKQNVVNSTQLSNWSRENSRQLCMTWEGITCNNVTGYVEKLELDWSSRRFPGPIEYISPSFWNLRHLNGTIPAEIATLRKLETLDLSENEFTGHVPQEIGHMEHLKVLNLRDNDLTGSIPDGIFSNCSSLEYVSLEINQQLQGIIPNTIGKLKKLEVIYLDETAFSGTIPPELGNCTSLSTLWANKGMQQGPIPLSLTGLPQLTVLRLYGLECRGLPQPLKQLLNMSRLESLNLIRNNATGSFPESIGKTLSLRELYLDSNSFTGQLPHDLDKFVKMTHFSVDTNGFSGPLPRSIIQMHRLEDLYLGNNKFTGEFPEVLRGSWQNLTTLDAGNNEFTGLFPSSLGQLPNIESLYMSSNNFTGMISTGFGRNLRFLDLSKNMLHGNLHHFFTDCSNLTQLSLQNNRFKGSLSHTTIVLRSTGLGGKIPSSIEQLERLEVLNLSGNDLNGTLPSEIAKLKRLKVLDLRGNLLEGPIPKGLEQLKNLVTLSLRLNKLWLERCTLLDHLKVGDNRLTGKIEVDLTKLTGLQMLSLSNNDFSGEVPKLAAGTHVKVLDLKGNKFSGQIPTFISELQYLRVLILEGNNLSGDIPDWIWRNLTKLQVLNLSGNKLTGKLPNGNILKGFKSTADNFSSLEYGIHGNAVYEEVPLRVKDIMVDYQYVLLATTLLDLSSNMLTGTIPKSLCDLSGLRYFVLANNNIFGEIPDCMGNVLSLEQLDLSSNNITGRIPESFKNLHSLESLNVSHNHLQGRIPSDAGQLSTFDESSYDGNPGLCGRPLPKPCGSSDKSDREDELREEKSTWWSIYVPIGFALGCIVGFACAMAL